MTENYIPNPETEYPYKSAQPPLPRYDASHNTPAFQASQEYIEPPSKPKNGFAITGFSISVLSFVLSILPLVYAFSVPLHDTDAIADFYFSAVFPLTVLGFIISIIGIVMSNRSNSSGGGWAVMGIVLSCIAFSIAVVAVLFLGLEYFFDMMS